MTDRDKEPEGQPSGNDWQGSQVHFSDAPAALARLVDNCLTFMNLTEFRSCTGMPGAKVTPWTFNGAEPFFQNNLHELLGGGGETDYNQVVPWAEPGDLDKPLDVSLITTATDGLLGLRRFRRVQGKEARGKVRWFFPAMVEVTDAFVGYDGNAEVIRMIYGHTPNRHWIPATDRWKAEDPTMFKTQGETIGVIHGLAFARRYTWRVLFAENGLPAVSFPVRPEVAYDLFTKRDTEVKDRRAALRHWVSEHWRELPHDPEYEVFVREHLRGRVRFTWAGYSCQIVPSDFDHSKLAEATAKRKEMKERGIDRRPRETSAPTIDV